MISNEDAIRENNAEVADQHRNPLPSPESVKAEAAGENIVLRSADFQRGG